MAIYASSSDSEEERATHQRTRLFARQRSIYSILGGGKVADILLWRDLKISTGLLLGMSLIWYLFEVVEYNFITLICHISITVMLLVFIWSTCADFLNWNRPMIPEVLLQESSFKQLALSFHITFNKTLSKFLDIACGINPPLFFVTAISLYIISIVGTYLSFVNLFFLGFVSMQTLPILYELYEEEVERIGAKLVRKLRRIYRKLDSHVLSKIPRGSVKQKKRI